MDKLMLSQRVQVAYGVGPLRGRGGYVRKLARPAGAYIELEGAAPVPEACRLFAADDYRARWVLVHPEWCAPAPLLPAHRPERARRLCPCPQPIVRCAPFTK